jgi:hypothetical protein
MVMIAGNNSSFEVNIHFEQKISGFQKIHLSLSQYTPPAKKKLMGLAHTRAARKTPLEHVESLFGAGRITDHHQPLMIISVRNVLSNLRCIGYLDGITERPLSVAEEANSFIPTKDGNFPSNRSYHILGEKNDRLIIDQWNPRDLIDFSWFISGVPVLWDDEDENSIYERIVAEEADHSHIWHLPRGNHPEATLTDRDHWEHLQQIFMQTLTDTRTKAFKRLNNYAKKNKLMREYNYLNNIIGLNAKNNIIQLINFGRLEDLGQKIKSLGVRRALCVDNGGSISVEFYPGGLFSARRGYYQTLIAAPNHRVHGTAYIVIELKDSAFSYLSEGAAK